MLLGRNSFGINTPISISLFAGHGEKGQVPAEKEI